MALTKRKVDALRYDPKGPAQQILWGGSDDLPGFGARVYPSGRKSFVLSYRSGRRARLLAVGGYGEVTVQEARSRAEKARVQAKDGTDPVEEREKARLGDTVRDLCAVFLERYAKKWRRSWKEDERRINQYIRPALGSKKLADLKRADVVRLHLRIGDHAPTEANRVVELLRRMLNLAAGWGMMDEDRKNPAKGIEWFEETERERWVTPEELPHLVEAIDAEENIYVAAAFRLYLLTGLRRNELLQLKWKDVDLTRRELRLSQTKTKARVVPLSEEAVAIFRQLPRQLGNGHVLPGNVPGKPLVNIAKAWSRVRARFWLATNPEEAVELRQRAEADVARRSKHAEKGPDAVESRLLELAGKEALKNNAPRLHDLRRSVGSWIATGGTSAAIVGKVLGHASLRSTQVYARIADTTARTALEEHGARIGPYLNAGGT